MEHHILKDMQSKQKLYNRMMKQYIEKVAQSPGEYIMQKSWYERVFKFNMSKSKS